MTALMQYLLDPQFVVMALAAVAAFATSSPSAASPVGRPPRF